MESYYHGCGLVVTSDALDRRPHPASHGPTDDGGPQEWRCEPTTRLRVDRGLHTTFFLQSDGYGNTLPSDKKERFGRLRRRHKRFQLDDREIRLNEGYRDIEKLGGDLALPRFVCADAARLLQRASAEQLPGGRMAWEALAAGAVLLAARDAGLDRDPATVATYAKATLERVCAAGRKLRCELDPVLPPVRDGVVDGVVATLEDAMDVRTALELVRVARELVALADTEPIGLGTSRVIVAAAAVYAADRLTDEKALTQQQVADAASTIVDTSRDRIKRYSQELHDAAESNHLDVAKKPPQARR